MQIGFACRDTYGVAAASETLIGGYVCTIEWCNTTPKQPRENIDVAMSVEEVFSWRWDEVYRDPKRELYMLALSLGKQECHACTCIQVYSFKVNWSLSTGGSFNLTVHVRSIQIHKF